MIIGITIIICMTVIYSVNRITSTWLQIELFRQNKQVNREVTADGR